MKKNIFLILLLTAQVMFISCKNDVVMPDDSNAIAGRRDYTWTADTIKFGYLHINSIWANTINDVWALSIVGGTYENIYRYNGIAWYKETSAPVPNTVSLWGTDKNLWISTHDGHIWKYYNNIFTSSENFFYEETEIDFYSMAGKNDDEIIACGGKSIPFNRDGLIYKYNGIAWQPDLVIKNYGNLYWVKYSRRNDKYYFLSYLDNKEATDTTRLIEYDGKRVNTLLYQKEGENFMINDIDGYLYITDGNKIYRYYNGRLNYLLEITEPNFKGQVWGRNKNDLIFQMKDGLIHYNGTDLEYILKFPNNVEYGSCAYVLDKDVFIHAFDNNSGYNIIYHGKLNK
jgi:hypothetical protein